MSAAADVINKANPDILLIQELTPKKFTQFKTLMMKVHKKSEDNFAYDPEAFLCTYSIYPLTTVPIKTRSSVQKSVVQTTAGPVTVYNVHFLRTVLRRSHNWQELHDEINGLVLNEIAATSGPVILGGDFNMTDQTQTYRDISKVLKNAHWEAGSGFGFTFPTSSRRIKRKLRLPPLVRIDHLFFNQELLSYAAQTLDDSGGSDHLPIVSEFILLNKP
jgi:vancomycin resistance protein VanJ